MGKKMKELEERVIRLLTDNKALEERLQEREERIKLLSNNLDRRIEDLSRARDTISALRFAVCRLESFHSKIVQAINTLALSLPKEERDHEDESNA